MATNIRQRGTAMRIAEYSYKPKRERDRRCGGAEKDRDKIFWSNESQRSSLLV